MRVLILGIVVAVSALVSSEELVKSFYFENGATLTLDLDNLRTNVKFIVPALWRKEGRIELEADVKLTSKVMELKHALRDNLKGFTIDYDKVSLTCCGGRMMKDDEPIYRYDGITHAAPVKVNISTHIPHKKKPVIPGNPWIPKPVQVNISPLETDNLLDIKVLDERGRSIDIAALYSARTIERK